MDKCTSHSPCFSDELTKNAEIKAMIETYNQKVNFFDFESLNQLTDCTEEDMIMFRWRFTIVSMGHNIRKYQKLKKNR